MLKSQLIASESIISLLVASLAAALTCYFLRKIGLKYGIVAKSSYRRDKVQQVPLLGGLGIYLSVVLVNTYIQDETLWKLIIATLPIAIVGVIDDIHEISARFKFSAQCLAALLWVGLFTPQAMVYTRLGLNPFLGTIVTCIFLVSLSNAYNFLDGSDGHVGTIAIVTLIGLGISDDSLWAQSLIVASATLGFMFHNFPPAKIYLGEVGSSFLGFAVGALATRLPVAEPGWSTFWAINFFCSLAFVDLLRVIYGRLRKGQAPWAADKGHIHHILNALGLGQLSTILFAFYITSVSAIIAIELQSQMQAEHKFVFAFLAVTALSTIYFGVLFFEKQLGKRSSVFGRQIISKYVHFDNRDLAEALDNSALVIDLLPYFSEIQSRGVIVVDRFAYEFGEFVAQQKMSFPFACWGPILSPLSITVK